MLLLGQRRCRRRLYCCTGCNLVFFIELFILIFLNIMISPVFFTSRTFIFYVSFILKL
jgi:hypothetical protein